MVLWAPIDGRFPMFASLDPRRQIGDCLEACAQICLLSLARRNSNRLYQTLCLKQEQVHSFGSVLRMLQLLLISLNMG
jgi:hypothetical protein